MSAETHKLEFLTNPYSESHIPLGELLIEQLNLQQWERFRAAVAFARFSGVQHISEALSKFASCRNVCISVGVDLGGTSEEALRELMASVMPNGQLWVFHNANTVTFHPKIYLFNNKNHALLAVGSSNFTEGGLFTNYEATLVAHLDLTNEADALCYQHVEAFLDTFATQEQNLAFPLTDKLLQLLISNGKVLSERSLIKLKKVQSAIQKKQMQTKERSPFGGVSFSAPTPGKTFLKKPSVTSKEDIQDDLDASVEAEDISSGTSTGFLMTLQKTDVGVGQTHEGTSRRSPELFVPLAARDHNPTFWGWPNKFTEDPARDGKFDRLAVKIRFGIEVVEVNMMTWPVKHDFRLRSETLRSAGDVGDILRIELAPDDAPFEYFAEVIPSGRADFTVWAEQCDTPVRNSKRKWGYY